MLMPVSSLKTRPDPGLRNPWCRLRWNARWAGDVPPGRESLLKLAELEPCVLNLGWQGKAPGWRAHTVGRKPRAGGGLLCRVSSRPVC